MIIDETKLNHKAPMGVISHLLDRRARIDQGDDINMSFEFFPPKSARSEEKLWQAIDALEIYNPEFISVTYGAGGTTQTRSFDTLRHILSKTSLKPAAHLTCVGARQEAIDTIAKTLWDDGVRHIVALRGDPAGGIGQTYQPIDKGYAYASDLVRGLKSVANFEVSVSAYPERHPESPSWQAEIDNLKRKIDAGATRAITQFFFSPDVFLRFQDRVFDAGINIPIKAGLMLQPNFKSLQHMSDLCGANVPHWYGDLFHGLDDNSQARDTLTTSLMLELIAQLYARGVRDFHLYTLNRAEMASYICHAFGMHRAIKMPR